MPPLPPKKKKVTKFAVIDGMWYSFYEKATYHISMQMGGSGNNEGGGGMGIRNLAVPDISETIPATCAHTTYMYFIMDFFVSQKVFTQYLHA